jgi:alkylglycerol monooxygenase
METYATILNYAILFFTALIALEFVASLILKKSVNYGLDTISSLSSGMTNTLKDVLGLGIVLLSYRWMFKHFAVFEINSTILLYIIGFILIDFSAYWSHRWNHVINIMWNRHVIHHSSEEFNLSAALRQSISGIIGVYFFLSIPMAVLGIPPEIIGIILPLHLFAQFWYHTRLINRMGFLEKIIVTPSHHRVHHAINPQYLDKNYAAVFIIWDKLFGTFQEELKEIPPVYGVKSPVNTWNPILINWMHAWQILKDAWYTKDWKDKFRIWFMPTGWRPADVVERFPIFYYEDDVYEQKKYRTSVNRFLLIWFWSQLTLHLLLEMYLFNQIAAFDYTQILLYGIFLFISIFGYTTLMDRHLLAIPAELIKMSLGIYLLVMMNGWYGLDNYISYASWFFGGYLFLSMGITLYYTLGEKTPKKQLLNDAKMG